MQQGKLGSIPVTGTLISRLTQKMKNLVRTRLKDDFKAIFEEVAKLVRYGAGKGNRTPISYLASRCSTTELYPRGAEGQTRTDITCSSDKRLDHLGYLGSLSYYIISIVGPVVKLVYTYASEAYPARGGGSSPLRPTGL